MALFYLVRAYSSGLAELLADNLGSIVGSVGDSEQPVIVGSSSEHALAETSPIARSDPLAAREEVAVDENVTALTTSTGLDADIVETKQVVSSAVLDSNDKESDEGKISAALDAEAKDNEEVDPTRSNSQHESLPPEAVSEVYESAAGREKESGETLDAVTADVTMETGGDDLWTPSDSGAGVDSVRESDSFVESSTPVDGIVEVDQSAKIAESDDRRIEEDNMRFHDLKVAEDLPSQESTTRKNESEEFSKEDSTLESQSSAGSTVTTGAELAESINPGVNSIRDDKSSYATESGSSSKVAGDESAVTAVVSFESQNTTETQADQTTSSIERIVQTYEDTGLKNIVPTVLGTDREEEGSGNADPGLPSDPVLITPGSLDETGAGLQLEKKTEISVKQEIRLHEDCDKVHECESALVDANVKELKAGEEQNFGDTNEGADLEKSHVLVPSENPSEKRDLLETQDEGEDLHKTGAKLVAEESIPPIDVSDVPNEGATAEHDPSSVLRDDANLNLSEETIGSSDDKAVGDAVDNPLSSDVEGNHNKELVRDLSGVHDESLRAQGGNDGIHHDAISGNDVLADSSGQTGSLEADLISSSAPSDVEVIPSNDFQESAEKEMASLKHEGSVRLQPGVGSQQSDNSDLFDPPSFMTLVEPKVDDALKDSVSETQTQQNPEQKGSPSPQAGWFPSVAHVAASESPGRKRNEEIIAKVSKSQRVALRSLLGEAYDDEKQAKPPSGKENVPLVGTKNGNSVTDAEAATDAGKEWSSLPKYLTKSKSEKGKPRSWWLPFLCCASANSGEISQ
ncbi:hypothetical protein AKJ16_DCAP10201 [Drosera capensis]